MATKKLPLDAPDYFCVYKTTHPAGFYYWGKGQTKLVLNGTYKGSGAKLKAAFISGYPYEEWTSTIYFLFNRDKEDAAYDKEKEIVTMEMLMDPWCLNTVRGGKGWRGLGTLTTKEVAKRTAKIVETKKKKGILNAPLTDAHKARLAEVSRKQDKSVQLEAMRKHNTGSKHPPERIAKRVAKVIGTKLKPATKAKMRDRQLSHQLIPCQHCGKMVKPAALARWHGDNCKSLKPKFAKVNLVKIHDAVWFYNCANGATVAVKIGDLVPDGYEFRDKRTAKKYAITEDKRLICVIKRKITPISFIDANGNIKKFRLGDTVPDGYDFKDQFASLPKYKYALSQSRVVILKDNK